MVRSVRGRLAALDAEGAVVEVGGVGLQVHVSASTLAWLPAVGERVELVTHLVVREEALDLYGFGAAGERDLFMALIGVSGVGPRLALAICGLDSPEGLRLALARGDTAVIRAAPGVGKRTAERVVLELRDRVGAMNGGGGTGGGTPVDEARDGLVALGFAPGEVDGALADTPAGLDAEAALRHGLGRLRRP